MFPVLNPLHNPPHPILLGHPSAPAPSTLYHASNLDWRFISHMIIYMFKCHSPKPNHPLPLPQSPKTVLYICFSFAVSHKGLSLSSFCILYICVSILYWCFSFWLTSLCIIGSSLDNIYFLCSLLIWAFFSLEHFRFIACWKQQVLRDHLLQDSSLR